MTAEKLLDAMELLDEKDIYAAGIVRPRAVRRRVKYSLLAACLSLAVIFVGTAYAGGRLSFAWVSQLFGWGEQAAQIENHTVELNQSAVSQGITMTLHSAVTDGTYLYLPFHVDSLSPEGLDRKLQFTLTLPNALGFNLGGYASGSIAILPMDSGSGTAPGGEYVLLAMLSGKESIAGKTVTLTGEYREQPTDRPLYQWSFRVPLGEALEATDYTLEDGTPVTVTALSVSVGNAAFFYQETAEKFLSYQIELDGGSKVELLRQNGFEEGFVDENGEKVPTQSVSSILTVTLIDPRRVTAIWAGDRCYPLRPQ